MGTILVCTRAEDILREMGALLQARHQVAVVPDMADAVRAALLNRFDAVVLDMDEETPQRLPSLPVIGRLNPRAPLVVVSAAASLEVEAAIRAAGVFSLLLRPLSPGELERHLAAALFWRSTWRPGSTHDANAAPAAC